MIIWLKTRQYYSCVRNTFVQMLHVPFNQIYVVFLYKNLSQDLKLSNLYERVINS